VGLLADVGVSATRRGREACLLKKRRSGMSSTKVAKKYDVSRATVCRISPRLNRDLRELAKSIVAASPALRDWEFHSARQPKKWDFKFELEDPKERGPIELEASTWKFVLLKYPDGKNKILLKAEAQTKLTKKQRKLAATIVLESILGEETLLNCVDDYRLVKELELRLTKMPRPIRRLRDAVRGVSKAN